MIIGITGYYGSGKDSMANYLVERSFIHYSLSDEIREELKKRKRKITRENLIKLGNELREKEGPSCLARRTRRKIDTARHHVITSIRNKNEVLALKELDNFLLIHVAAPIEQRFERIKKRNRESDPKTIEELKQKELQEQSSDPTHQQLHLVTGMADITINNDLTLENFYKKIDKFLQDWGPKLKKEVNWDEHFMEIAHDNETESKKINAKRKNYISWDEYFAGITLLSAQRSKDPVTQTGACIVDKNKKIIGIGYNGFPIGCSDDILPWTKNSKNMVDVKYTYIVHAEANAILNASRNTEGATLYVDLFPCHECAKLIIQSGIKEIVYLRDKYKDYDSTKAAKRMFKLAKIKIRKFIPTNKEILLKYY